MDQFFALYWFKIKGLVAIDIVFDVTAKEFHAIYFQHTVPTFFAARLGALVIAYVVEPLAWLWAREHLMHGLRMAFRKASVTACAETPVTREQTPPLGANVGEIFRLRDPYLCFHMPWTTKAKSFAHWVIYTEHSKNFGPHRNIRIRFGIANEVHAVLSTAQKDVGAICSLEKPNLSLTIAPDKGNDYDLRFLALKIIHGGDSQQLVHSFLLENWTSCSHLTSVFH